MTKTQSTTTSLPVWVRETRRAEGKCELCGAHGDSTWAGTGELLCWAHIDAKRAA